jgi:hypothetical protein
LRDFMEELRGAGVQTGGPAAFHARDRQAFANQLDRWLAQRLRAQGSRDAGASCKASTNIRRTASRLAPLPRLLHERVRDYRSWLSLLPRRL